MIILPAVLKAQMNWQMQDNNYLTENLLNKS